MPQTVFIASVIVLRFRIVSAAEFNGAVRGKCADYRTCFGVFPMHRGYRLNPEPITVHAAVRSPVKPEVIRRYNDRPSCKGSFITCCPAVVRSFIQFSIHFIDDSDVVVIRAFCY